jgi:hypothetical protein
LQNSVLHSFGRQSCGVIQKVGKWRSLQSQYAQLSEDFLLANSQMQ